MHPDRQAQKILESLETMPHKVDDSIAHAQVYAILALAQAIDGLGTDIRETLRNVDVEISSVAQAVDSLAQAVNNLDFNK